MDEEDFCETETSMPVTTSTSKFSVGEIHKRLKSEGREVCSCHKPMTTSNPKYCVGEVFKDSNPMAERSATVTRRVPLAKGERFCEA